MEPTPVSDLFRDVEQRLASLGDMNGMFDVSDIRKVDSVVQNCNGHDLFNITRTLDNIIRRLEQIERRLIELEDEE